MSALGFTYNVVVTPDANPETIAQFLAATNQRVLLKAIEVVLQGVSAAVAPIPFEVVSQNEAGSSADDTASQKKDLPEASETIQTTVRKTFEGEPATNTKRAEFGLHEQSTRMWIPPTGAIIIPGGGRLGLRYLSATFVPVRVTFWLEE